jgi:hypothetical protein
MDTSEHPLDGLRSCEPETKQHEEPWPHQSPFLQPYKKPTQPDSGAAVK